RSAGLQACSGCRASFQACPSLLIHSRPSYPHDRTAFTQGLEYLNGFLYEGTGLNGRSSIRKVKLETGEVVQRRDVPAQYFGEGITIWKDNLYELTWQSQVALVYDRATFSPKRT